MTDNTDFIEGLFIKPPIKKDGAPLPEWIKAKGSIKVADLIGWLQTVQTEWVNFDVKESKKGNWYVAVNTWEPTKDEEYAKGAAQAREALNGQGAGHSPVDIDDDDIPF